MTPAQSSVTQLLLEHRRPRRGWAVGRRPGPAATLLPRIDGYQLLRKVGEGRLAAVYLAHDTAGKPVALKLLRREHARNDARTAAFAREFAVPRAIRSPHIVRVFEQLIGDGYVAIAIEYLGGGHLGDIIRERPTPGAALFLLRQAALALDALHRAGYAHGDVKPANLLLRATGELVLADFGSARRLNDVPLAAQPGLVTGTPRYAAPEQSESGAAAPASDVYSLGIVCYEMLCGKPPFPGETVMEVRCQHLLAAVPPLPDELARLQPLLDGMLARQAGSRLADGRAVVELIDFILGAAPLHPTPSGAFSSRCPT